MRLFQSPFILTPAAARAQAPAGNGEKYGLSGKFIGSNGLGSSAGTESAEHAHCHRFLSRETRQVTICKHLPGLDFRSDPPQNTANFNKFPNSSKRMKHVPIL
jgi:hypothetical protein